MKAKITHLILTALLASATSAPAFVLIQDDFTWNSVDGGNQVLGNTLNIDWTTDLTGSASDLTSIGDTGGFSSTTSGSKIGTNGYAFRARGFTFTFTADDTYYLTDLALAVGAASSAGNNRAATGDLTITISSGAGNVFSGTESWDGPNTGFETPDWNFSQTNHLLKAGTEYTFTALVSNQSSGFSAFDSLQIEVVVAPEPSSTALLGLGGLALMLRRKRS